MPSTAAPLRPGSPPAAANDTDQGGEYDASQFPPIDVMPQDITGYAKGNTGVAYVHRLDSVRPGPTVMINALTHGNEFCGVTAVATLLEAGLQPLAGQVILSFANVEAYHRFDPARPSLSRFVDRDLNRVWDDAVIDAEPTDAETRRARELRPVLHDVDVLLDLHSTIFGHEAFWVLDPMPRAIDLAKRLSVPGRRVILDVNGMQGRGLFHYGRFGDPNDTPIGLVAECGQHWDRRSGDVALAASVDLLSFLKVIDDDTAGALRPDVTDAPPVEFRTTVEIAATTDRFRTARPFQGFEAVTEGEVIAWDGDTPVHAPHADCHVLIARPHPKRGGEAMTLGRRMT